LSELLLAQRFVLGFSLTKIGTGRGIGSLLLRRLTSAAKAEHRMLISVIATKCRANHWFLSGPALSADSIALLFPKKIER